MSTNPIYFGDSNKGLVYSSATNFGLTPDGPVLYGWNGGVLGSMNATANTPTYGNLKATLAWTQTSVGIGTTSPSYNLDVQGTLRATGAITAGSSIAATGSISGGAISATTATTSANIWVKRTFSITGTTLYSTPTWWRIATFNASSYCSGCLTINGLRANVSSPLNFTANIGFHTLNPSLYASLTYDCPVTSADLFANGVFDIMLYIDNSKNLFVYAKQNANYLSMSLDVTCTQFEGNGHTIYPSTSFGLTYAATNAQLMAADTTLGSVLSSTSFYSLCGTNIRSTKGTVFSCPQITTTIGQSNIMPGILAVNDTNDSGAYRGIRYWQASDPNWATYMCSYGAGKSTTGGTACTSLDGRTLHHIRDRVNNTNNQGFLWENTAEACLMSLTADTGNLFIKGTIGSSSVRVGGTAYFNGVDCGSITTNNNNVTVGSGTVSCGYVKTSGNNTFLQNTSGSIGFIEYSDGSTYYQLATNSGDSAGSFNSLRPYFWNLSTGDVFLANAQVSFAHSSGAITCKTINTQNNAINAGTGSITCGAITTQGESINSFATSFDATTTNACRDIAQYAGVTGCVAFIVMVVQSAGYQTHTKEYSFAAGYNITNGGWQRCMPRSASNNNLDACELHMWSSNNNTKFRLVHSVVNQAATPTVTIHAFYNQNDPLAMTNLTANAQYTDANWATYSYVSTTVLTQTGGQVGVGTATPSYTLDVTGTFRATGAVGVGSLSSTGTITTNNNNINAGTGQLTANNIVSGSGSVVNVRTSQLALWSGGDVNLGVKLWTNNYDGALYGGSNQGGLASWSGISFRCTADSTERHLFDTRTGNADFLGALKLGNGLTVTAGGLTVSAGGLNVTGTITGGSIGVNGVTSPTCQIHMGTIGTTSKQLGLYSGQSGWYGFGATASTLQYQTGGDHAFFISSSSAATGTEAMRIKITTGYVGIGMSSPATPLHVNGDIRAENAGNILAYRNNGTQHDANKVADVYVGRYDGSNTSDFLGMVCRVTSNTAENPNTSANHGHIFFKTWGNSIANSTERMRIRSDGNVGIGTANPTYTLDVSGTLRTTGAATVNSLSTTAGQTNMMPGMLVVNDGTDAGSARGVRWWLNTNTDWATYMTTAGANKSTLSANGTCSSLDGRTQHQLRNRVASGNGWGFVWENSSEVCLMSLTGDTGNLFIKGTIGSSSARVGGTAYLNGVDCTSVTTSGGITCTSSTLTSAGTTSTLASTTYAGGLTSGNYIMTSCGVNGSTNNCGYSAFNYTSGAGSSNNYYAFGMSGSTIGSATFNVCGNGNFGICTASPAYTLDINGSARVHTNLLVTGTIGTSSARTGNVWINDANTGKIGANGNPCNFGTITPTTTGGSGYCLGTAALPWADLYTYGNHYSTGNVGMTANSTASLTPAAPFHMFATADANYNTMILGTPNGGLSSIVFDDLATYKWKVQTNAGSLEFLRHTNSAAGAATNYTTTSFTREAYFDSTGKLWCNGTGAISDRRLKTNITPISGALDKVSALKGCVFDYKHPAAHHGETQTSGFVAQDLQDVFPDMVHPCKVSDDEMAEIPEGDEPLGISLSLGMTAHLVEAIKELRAQKDQEIQELKNLVSNLASRLDALEIR